MKKPCDNSSCLELSNFSSSFADDPEIRKGWIEENMDVASNPLESSKAIRLSGEVNLNFNSLSDISLDISDEGQKQEKHQITNSHILKSIHQEKLRVIRNWVWLNLLLALVSLAYGIRK